MQKELTKLQERAIEIFHKYEELSLQKKIDLIAETFGCKTGVICTSPCTGKWRGTSDISIRFDNGTSLFIGNRLTPKAKTVKVQTEYVNSALVQYNPEIVQATKEAALPMLLQREAKDNKIAVRKGLKPYTLLNVEFNEGADYMGWYYVTLAVDGKICTHLETGLHYDIAEGKVSENLTRISYFPAGGLKEADVDYVFNNAGYSSSSTLYTLPLQKDVRKRAEKTLAERNAARSVSSSENEKSMRNIQTVAYEKYKLAWMLRLGFTLDNIIKGLSEQQKVSEEVGEKADLADSFKNWEMDTGFAGGSIWVCFDEFLENEYRNKEFMQSILTDEEFRKYLDDVDDGWVPFVEAKKLVLEAVQNGALNSAKVGEEGEELLIGIARTTGWYYEPVDQVARELMYDKEGRDMICAAIREKENMQENI